MWSIEFRYVPRASWRQLEKSWNIKSKLRNNQDLYLTSVILILYIYIVWCWILTVIIYQNQKWRWIYRPDKTVIPNKQKPLFRGIGNYHSGLWKQAWNRLTTKSDLQIHAVKPLSRKGCVAGYIAWWWDTTMPKPVSSPPESRFPVLRTQGVIGDGIFSLSICRV